MTAVILLREFAANWLLMSFLQKQLDISHARHKKPGIMPHWFSPTIHSYISSKCHCFVLCCWIMGIFITHFILLYPWQKKHIKVFTYWQKFTRSYLYSCQFDAEICLEYFGMKIEAKYAFLNAKTHFFSFFLFLFVCPCHSSDVLLKLPSVRNLDSLFCFPSRFYQWR